MWPFSKPASAKVGVLAGDGKFEFPIVGESHYQAELEKICGGKSEKSARAKHAALLLPEPENPYDRNAVCVRILDKTVGYLGRDVARELLSILINSGFERAAVEAVIVGGWRRAEDEGHFGVKLNAVLPFRIMSDDQYFQSKKHR